MQFALGIVYLITRAQGVQTVFLAGMFFAREDQRVGNLAVVLDPPPGFTQGAEFRIEESDIKRGIVNDQFTVADEINEPLGNIGKARLVPQGLVANAMHIKRAVIDLPPRVEILMKILPGPAPVYHLDTADLHDPVALPGFKPRGLGVQYDLSHKIPA